MKDYNFKKVIYVICAAAICGLSFTACDNTDNSDSLEAAVSEVAKNSDFSAEVLSAGISDDMIDSAVNICLNGESASCDGSGVDIADNIITVSEGGNYVISGKLNDGQIIFDTKSEVNIILNNADISCSFGTPLYIGKVGTAAIMLCKNTSNSITDTRSVSTEPEDSEESDKGLKDSAVYSKSDIVISGAGSLEITTSFGNGIQSKDNIGISEGIVSISAVNNCLKANDSLSISGGNITLNSLSGDGIKCGTGSDDTSVTEQGLIVITGGDISINSEDGNGINAEYALQIDGGILDIVSMYDGMQSDGNLTVNGGDISVYTYQGSDYSQYSQNGGNYTENVSNLSAVELSAVQSENQSVRGGRQHNDIGGGNMGEIIDEGNSNTIDESAKGIKADGNIEINGGNIVIDATDDAIHSDSSITVTGGVLTLSSADDGIHADGLVNIDSGTIDVLNSYEGIEGAIITVNGGEIHISSSDDGFNASNGTAGGFWGIFTDTDDEENEYSDLSPEIIINDGYIYVDANGDGIDSNGNMTFNGGTVIVNGPTDSMNGALDCGDNNNTISVNGGTLIAVGSVGMAESPDGNASTQYSFITNVSASAGDIMNITDSDGNVLYTFSSSKNVQSVVFSSPQLEQGMVCVISTGGTYDGGTEKDGVYTGGTYSGGTQSATIEISDIANGNSFGGFGNMGGGKMQDFEDGDFTMPDGMEMPSGDFEIPDGMEMPSGDFEIPDGMEMPSGDFTMPEGMEMPPDDKEFSPQQ